MSTEKMSKELAQQALDALALHGNKVKAALALGISRGAMQGRVWAAERYKLTPATVAVPVSAAPVDNAMADRVFELESLIKTMRAETLTDEWVKRKIGSLSEQVELVESPEWLLEPKRGKTLPGVPIAMWSDWHWGEVVFPHQVNGVNEFNMLIAHKRARKLVERTIYLLREHVVNPDYPGIVLNLGGDMLSGDIHDELSNSNEMPIIPSLLDVYGVLLWAIRALAAEFGNVFVPCVTGNHGRLSRKPQAKNRNHTNLDWLIYQFLARAFEGDKRVRFYIPDGPDALYSAFGHKYLLTHGDQFRGGDGIIGAIGPITRGNQRKLARNSSINREYDTMILGHWHQYMPLHRTMVNGSLKGYDEYANVSNFGFEPPIQALWLTHPEHGVTMHLPVYLEQHPGRDAGAPWIQFQDAA